MQRQTNSSSDTVLMQIAYTDTMGERKVVEKEVKIANTASTTGTTSFQGRTASQQNSVLSNYTWYLLGLIVLVGGVIAHRKYTSRKMIDPDFKMKDLFKSK